MSYCGTFGHQFSDVCGACETLNGIPVQYSPKPSDIAPIKDDGIIGNVDLRTGVYTPSRKTTNGDLFRSKSDEELAKFINSVQNDAYVSGMDGKVVSEEYRKEGYCGWLFWLKQEVE